MWVVLIAGSTGSALRAVSPPNLHITPDVRRDLVYAASATGFLYRSPVAIIAQATPAKVKQAALDVLSTAEDEGDGVEMLLPERLLHTLPQAEAEAWRSRLIAMRDFSTHAPSDRKMH
jgi:hypothetical protein